MVSESVAQGASLPRGVGACIHTLPESVVSLIPWRPRCSEEAAVPLGRPQSRKRCSDARDVCCTRQQTGEFCADPFLSIPAVRQLSAGKGVGRSASSSGSPKGGGRRRRRTSRATVAREGRTLCGAAHWGGDLCAGEKVRERAGVAGARVRRLSRPGDERGSSSSRCP